MKPIIGIPLRPEKDTETNLYMYTIYENLIRSIQSLGADIMPIVPPLECDSSKTKYSDYESLSDEGIKTLNRFLKLCDGFILPGGNRYVPTNQYIIEYAIRNDIPILGICFGMQEMACFRKDFLVDKIDSSTIKHCQNKTDDFQHSIYIKKDSLLYEIMQEDNIKVNSFHNYKVRPSDYYEIVANSEDGIIEAIVYPKNTFNMGVQWHPERPSDADIYSQKLLKYFIEKATLKNSSIPKSI